jgi:hypothetical protein
MDGVLISESATAIKSIISGRECLAENAIMCLLLSLLCAVEILRFRFRSTYEVLNRLKAKTQSGSLGNASMVGTYVC